MDALTSRFTQPPPLPSFLRGVWMKNSIRNRFLPQVRPTFYSTVRQKLYSYLFICLITSVLSDHSQCEHARAADRSASCSKLYFFFIAEFSCSRFRGLVLQLLKFSCNQLLIVGKLTLMTICECLIYLHHTLFICTNTIFLRFCQCNVRMNSRKFRSGACRRLLCES